MYVTIGLDNKSTMYYVWYNWFKQQLCNGNTSIYKRP